MMSFVNELLEQHEAGSLSRRELFATLLALGVSPNGLGGTRTATVGAAKQINHVTIYVENVDRSVQFYERLFGMSVLTSQGAGLNLRAGSSFLGIYPAQERPKGINHVCFGLKHFDADGVEQKLKAAGVSTVDIRSRGETKELYFTDPDGIRVQLQDVRYRGGVGPIGDRMPK